MSTHPQIKNILLRTLSIIENPDNWTKNYAARDKNDKYISAEDPKAVKYCLLGALWKASSQLFPVETKARAREEATYKIKNILYKLDRKYKDLNLGVFNDAPETTHEDVITILNTTIESL